MKTRPLPFAIALFASLGSVATPALAGDIIVRCTGTVTEVISALPAPFTSAAAGDPVELIFSVIDAPAIGLDIWHYDVDYPESSVRIGDAVSGFPVNTPWLGFNIGNNPTFDVIVAAGQIVPSQAAFALNLNDPSATTFDDFDISTMVGTSIGPFPTAISEMALVTGAGFALFSSVDLISFETPGAVGVPYCTSTVNSTGWASEISASGSASLSANDLVLSANNLPSEPGIFIAGPNQAEIPLFDGYLCVSPTGLQRFIRVASPMAGVITENVDVTAAAIGGLNVTPGSSYFYQRWNRDSAAGGSGANFSNGIEVRYVP